MRCDGNNSKCGGGNHDGCSAPASDVNDRSGRDGTERGGDGIVSEASWFEPVDIDATTECPGGVCPVPWATQVVDTKEKEVKKSTDVVEGRPKLYDDVYCPSHYNNGSIECIEAIEAALTLEEYQGMCKGNVMKYLWRHRYKGGVESLKKAKWYLDNLIRSFDED